MRLSSRPSTIELLSSDEPSSMTIISQSCRVCITTERAAASTVGALLRIDMMIETIGD
jgi:hypothetical protein